MIPFTSATTTTTTTFTACGRGLTAVTTDTSSLQHCQKQQGRWFHSSAVTNGRKCRYKLRARFFDPRHRWFEHRANMWRLGLTNERFHLGQICGTFYIPNYPQGDKYREEKKLIVEDDELRNAYEKTYPEESLYVLERNRHDDMEWYKTPWQRFFESYQQLKNDGMSDEEAIQISVQEKEWENEVIEAEKQVCKKQAEEIFGFQNNYFTKLQQPDPIEARIDHDPRIAEHELKLARDKLDELVRQRIKNPSLPKITLRDCGLPLATVVHYISSNSGLGNRNFFVSSSDFDLEPTSNSKAVSVGEHFDESIYHGSADKFLQHFLGRRREEYEEDEKEEAQNRRMMQDDDEDEEEQPGERPFDFRKTPEYHKMPESEKMKLHLRDLDVSMKAWAKELLPMFADKQDPNDAPDLEEHNRRVMNNTAINVLKYSYKNSLKRGLHQNLDDIIINQDDLFKPHSPSATHIDPHIPKGDMLRGPLADELSRIFGDKK